MAKKFDATLKQLVEARPLDWLDLGGLPHGDVARPVDADVSSVTSAADKVFLVEGPSPYIAHMEFQTGADAGLDRRVLLYNVLLRSRHELPVRSVAFLLTPKAAGPAVTGGYAERLDETHAIDFSYRVVRAWELPTETLLAGGVGTLPLVPLTVGEAELPRVLERAVERFRQALPKPEADDLLTAMYIISGLRFDRVLVDQLLAGVRQMQESSTYQAILEKGIEKGLERGELKGARLSLLRVGRRRFGEPTADTLRRLEQVDNAEQLETLVERALDAASWDELLATLPEKR